MGDPIEAAARAVLSHPWGSGPWTAHTEHKFDPDCAVCRGDVRAILTVAASAGGAMPDDLAAVRERINRANTELGDVCAQGPSRRFRMHVPVDPERDTDLIIGAALDDAERLASEVEHLRATGARVRGLAERWRHTSDRKNGPRAELLAALDGPAVVSEQTGGCDG
ncbi:hypothetical protein ACFYOK_29520 [Microbispora bryophytorum]|uniref:hypothetical protein n=1 Tax=Microbispora bryophytorum TaxID=1460882 RepID=UPI0033C43E0E